MRWLIFEPATGIVVGSVRAGPKPRVLDHHDAIESDTTAELADLRVVDGVVTAHDRDRDVLRADQWRRVRQARDRAEWGGCPTPLGRVDTDADSQRKVSGSVQLAMIAQGAGQPFAIDWTMQDNSSATHDAPAMIAMGVAVGQHVAACHAEGLARREAIDAAADADTIRAVPIEGGWPGAAA